MKSYVCKQYLIHDVKAAMKCDLVHDLKSEIGKAHLNYVFSVLFSSTTMHETPDVASCITCARNTMHNFYISKSTWFVVGSVWICMYEFQYNKGLNGQMDRQTHLQNLADNWWMVTHKYRALAFSYQSLESTQPVNKSPPPPASTYDLWTDTFRFPPKKHSVKCIQCILVKVLWMVTHK